MTPPDPRAAELHRRLFKIDTHMDTPTSGMLLHPGWDFGARHESDDDFTRCDLPRMTEGGLDAVFFAAFIMQGARKPEANAAARASLRHIVANTRAHVARHPLHCAIAATAGDGPRLKAEGRRAIYLSVENGYAVAGEPAMLAELRAQGVRMFGFTHLNNNDLADSSTDPRGPEWNGLSPVGREVVAECNRLGLLLDASHASDAVVRQLFEHSRAPVILSHTNCAALSPQTRNIGDDLLRELAAAGGVIQLNVINAFVRIGADQAFQSVLAGYVARSDGAVPTLDYIIKSSQASHATARERSQLPGPSLDDFVRHIEHAVEVAGINHVGIGTDLDGGGDGTVFRDVTEYPLLTAALLARGWSEEHLAKFWGGNTLRVLRAAEDFAAK